MKYKENPFRKIQKNTAILTARALHTLCRVLRRGGTSCPGNVAMRIYPDMLSELAAQVKVIIVSGTNGKTTTVHMAAHILHSMQISCAYSHNGENLEESILTVLLNNYDLRKKGPVSDIAVLECDEKYVPKLLDALNPVCITITNISDDQVDRLGSPEDVARMFAETFSRYQGIVCIDPSEPYVKQTVEPGIPGELIEYGSDKDEIIIQGQHYPVVLDIPGEYNIKNAASAMAAIYAAGFSIDGAAASLRSMKPVFGRMEEFRIGSTPVMMNLSKNNVGVIDSLQYIAANYPSVRVVLGFNNNVEDGEDLSWLGTVPWKEYNKYFQEVIVYNAHCKEVEKYMISAGISYRTAQNTKQLISIVQESNETVFMILNYTCMMDIRKVLARKKYVPDFWK